MHEELLKHWDSGHVPDEAELRSLVATACRILHVLGLADYMGHVSARIPDTDRIVVKPKHSTTITGFDRMRPEDMVVVGLDGKLVGQHGDNVPPNEVAIHTAIYRARSDVMSVVHTHQPMATLMGVVEAPILPVLHLEGPLVERGVPVFPCARLVISSDLGDKLAQALGDYPVCHLQGHGIVSVAGTVQEATLGAIFLERLSTINYQASAMGRKPRVIPPDEMASLKEELAPPVGRWAYYAHMAESSQA